MSELELKNDIEIPEDDDSLLNDEWDLKDNIYSELVLELLKIRNNMK